IKMGVEGQYLASTGELKQQSWDQSGLTTQTYKDGELVESSTERPEEGQDGHDLYAQQEQERREQEEAQRAELERQHELEREREVSSHTNPNSDPDTIYSDSQDKQLDSHVDQFQRSDMRNSEYEYRDEVVIGTRPSLEGRY